MLSKLACFLVVSSIACLAVDNYSLSTESSQRALGVEAGELTFFEFATSKVYNGTSRGCWLYVPKAHTGEAAAALMIFQDGHAYVSEDGQMRAPIVLDNLMATGAMPTTIALFINPGHRGDNKPNDKDWGKRSNRSVEYDTPNGDYAKFLIDELIPHVESTYKVKFSTDPARRAISGMSSGGICAWTVAWERPDQFGKVLSHIGSFTNIRGGHVYPALIRKTERKPIRVFLQDGTNDLNNSHGSWPLANQQMAQSLGFAGYDHRFVFGDGAHNGEHGGAILPDSLRWLWRDWQQTLQSAEPPEPLSAKWELVGQGYEFTDGACTHPQTRAVYFSDLPNGTVFKQDATSTGPQPFLSKGPKVSGLDFGPDGGLYAAVQGHGDDKKKLLVRIDPKTKAIETVANGLNPNDLVVSRIGMLYVTDTKAGAVLRTPISVRSLSRPPVFTGGIVKPNGIALSPNEDMLYVSEYGGKYVWRYLLSPEGKLEGGERFATLASVDGREDTGGDGMVVSSAGDLYVTSHAGIQVIDPEGRLRGVLPKPQDKATVSLAIASDHLYACSADRVYRLRLSGK